MSADVDVAVRAAMAELRARESDHPVHRRRDLLDLGITDELQSAMLRRGCLVRLRHGVYALPPAAMGDDPVSRHRRDLAAAVAASGEPTWAFGASAALLHGFPLPFEVPNRMCLARPSGGDERALRRPSRHRLVIPQADVTTGPVDPLSTQVIHGVATVHPALAAIGTAVRFDSARWRTAVFDAALWRGATPDELQRLIDAWRHLGRRAETEDALKRARSGAQTVLETFSRLALVEEGIPEPALQQAFHDADGLIGYTDMWWPDWGVIGEADGAVKYHDRDDLIREKSREDRLRALGWAVVRWTFTDIRERPGHVADRIRRAGARGR
jgi:hypothetical protein